MASDFALMQSLRNQAVSLLRILESRLGWSTARPILSAAKLHSARGWQESIRRAEQDEYKESVLIEIVKVLKAAVGNQASVGGKRVTFYDLRILNDSASDALIEWTTTRGLTDFKHALLNKPFGISSVPTDPTGLRPYKDSDLMPIACKYTNGKLFLQYFSARSFYIRETLSLSELTPAQAKFFRGYDELIGIKSVLLPCFDTIVIDTNERLVQIRMDFRPGMNEDTNSAAFSQIMKHLNGLTINACGYEALGVGVINLHPSINPMYVDQNCGAVTALGFVATGTSSSSNNHGKIHRTKGQDIRKDGFHVGGKGAVNKIDPYTIGITWSPPVSKSELSLEIRGSVRAIYSGKLSDVTQTEFVGCMDETDFDFLTSAILSRIKRRSK